LTVTLGDGITICTILNGESKTLENSQDWSVWMKKVQNLSIGTIRSFTKSMERFWLWSLFNPVEEEESFTFYLARFREDLLNGFVLEETIKDKWDDSPIVVPLLVSRPLQKQTVNKVMAGIRSYFYYNELENLLDDQRFINHLYEYHKSKRGRLNSMDVRKGNCM